MNDSAQPFYFVFTCFWMLVLISLQKHNSSPRLPTKLFCYISSYCSQCSPCYSFIETKCIHLLSKFIPVLQLKAIKKILLGLFYHVRKLESAHIKENKPIALFSAFTLRQRQHIKNTAVKSFLLVISRSDHFDVKKWRNRKKLWIAG